MVDVRNLGDAAALATSALLERMATYLPSLVAALLLVFAGWLLAKAVRALTVRVALLADTLLPKIGLPSGISRVRIGRSSRIAGTVAYWVVLLFFVTAATQVMGLRAFSDWLTRLIEYLPTLVIGLLILAAGLALSGLAANMIQATASGLAPRQRDALARIGRITILTGAILVGADQIGIRITFLAIFVGAIAAMVGGGVALAVGIGAREHVANLIAAHQLRQQFTIGQEVSFAGYEGRLLDLTANGVVIETRDGRVTLPARMFNEHPILVRTGNRHA